MKHKIPELNYIAILYEDDRDIFAWGFRYEIETINGIAKAITPCQRGHFIVELSFLDVKDRTYISIEQFILISDQLIYIDRKFEKEKAKEKQRCQNRSSKKEKSRSPR